MRRLTFLLVSILVLTGAAIVEAARLGHIALLVLCALAAIIAGVLVSTSTRPSVRLRGDLWSWVDRVSAATGEAPDDLVDRAVSAYRIRLTDGGDPDDS